jgi:hypothetical protein
MPFSPIAEDDLAPAGFTPIAESDLGPPPAFSATPDSHFLPTSFADAARGVKEGFAGLGRGIASANDFATRAIFHPADTLGKNPAATFREGMRGVNSNIPFANAAVEKLGGPAAESPEDAAAAPGAREFGSLAAAPAVGKVVGGIAAKGIEAAGGAAAQAADRIATAVHRARAERVIKGVQDLGTKIQGSKIELGKDTVREVLHGDPALATKLDSALGKPKVLAERVSSEMETAGAKIGDAYKSADSVALGAPVADVRRSLLLAARNYNTTAEKPLRDLITKHAEAITEEFGKDGRVPLTRLWEERKALQRRGFAGSSLHPSVTKEAQQDAAQAFQRVLDKRIDEIGSLANDVRNASTPTLAESGPLQSYAAATKALEDLPALNKRYSALARLSDATERAAAAPPAKEPGLLSQALHHGKAKGAGALIGSAIGHHVAGYPGAVAGAAAGAKAGSLAAGTYQNAAAAVARAVQAARAGQPITDQMVSELAAAGVGAKAIEALSAQRPLQPATAQ